MIHPPIRHPPVKKTPLLENCVIQYFFFFAEASGGKNEGASTEATEAATQGCVGTLVCDIFSTPSVLGRFAYFCFVWQSVDEPKVVSQVTCPL
jgi:hypothetical protein